MPQLDILYFPSQILWLLISFLSLYFIVKYIFVPKIESLLEYRASQIKTNLEEAAKFTDIAKSLEENYNNLHMEMHNQISSIRLDVINSANKEKAQKIADLNQKILKKEGAMLAKIAQAKEKAIEEMPEYILEHSSLLIQKITGQAVDMKELRKFYSENKC